MTALFSKLRDALRGYHLGFRSADESLGKDWMLGLTWVLYDLSTFHVKLSERHACMPARFEFSKDANDCARKKKPPPAFNQEAVAAALTKLMPLQLSPILDQGGWHE